MSVDNSKRRSSETISAGGAERRISYVIPIVVALITALGAIVVAIISIVPPPPIVKRPIPLRVDLSDYVGSCPVTITASADISVVSGSGKVSYRWWLNGKNPTDVETISFNAPATKEVRLTRSLTGSASPVNEESQFIQIEILDPKVGLSKQTYFKIRCT